MKPVALCATFLTLFAFTVTAQPPEEMERLVDRIALYPDPLSGNILAASTYSWPTAPL